ncbi:hypothetical protein ES703_119791 [subsurface metagenome]
MAGDSDIDAVISQIFNASHYVYQTAGDGTGGGGDANNLSVGTFADGGKGAD